MTLTGDFCHVIITDLKAHFPALPPHKSFQLILEDAWSTRLIYRRYDDFSVLHQLLRENYPGIELPSLSQRRSSIFGFLSATRNAATPSRDAPEPAVETFMRFLLTHPVLSLSSECQSFLHPRANIHAHVLSLIYTTDVALEDIVQYKMNSGAHGGGFGAGGDDGPANPLDAFASLACQMDGTTTAPKPMPTLFEESGDEDARPVRVKARQSVDDYQLVRVLGKGCVGKVLLAREKRTKRLFAIKAISKHWVASHGRQEIEHTKAEQRILADLSQRRHPFLIRLHCSFQNADTLFLVLDYVCGGDLATQLAKWHRFCESRSRFYCAQMVEGITELHRLGIIYRDLKPENVLLDASGNIKLTDFGLSKQFRISHKIDQHDDAVCPGGDGCQHAKTKTFCGTAEYLAPEVLLEQPYGYEVDWWSLGTFLYEMLTGFTPFWSENQVEMYQRVLEDNLEFPDGVMSNEARHFIFQLLQRRPTDRLGYGSNGADMIRRHPFFQYVDWAELVALRLPPPYVPRLRSEFDFSHFDEEFTNMSPRLSPPACDHECQCACALSQSVQEQFAGYTFISNSAKQLMLDKFGSPHAVVGTPCGVSPIARSWMSKRQWRRRSSAGSTKMAWMNDDNNNNTSGGMAFTMDL